MAAWQAEDLTQLSTRLALQQLTLCIELVSLGQQCLQVRASIDNVLLASCNQAITKTIVRALAALERLAGSKAVARC